MIPTNILDAPNNHRGFLHNSFLGKAVRGGVSRVLDVAQNLPGPAGFIAGGINRFIPRGGGSLPPIVGITPHLAPDRRANPFVPPGRHTGTAGQGVGQIVIEGNQFGGGGGGSGTMVVQGTTGTQLLCPKGRHPNRSSYFLKNGTWIPKETRCVANRRRNPDNGKASLKAARRLIARKRRQDTVDKALKGIVGPSRSRSRKPAALPKGTTIVQN